MKYFILWVLLINSLRADCVLTKGTDGLHGEMYTLENEYVKVVLLPESNGRMSSFSLKADGTERPLFPELVFEVFAITPDVKTVTATNYAGLEDWIWEDGLVKKYLPYSVEVLTASRDVCSLKLSTGSIIYNLERTITLRKNTAAVEIQVRIIGRDKEPKTLSYWSHIGISLDRNPDNANTHLFVPLKPLADPQIRKNIKVQQVGQSGIYSKACNLRSFSASDFFQPCRPWIAITKNKLLMGMIVPLDNILPDGCFYSCASENILTAEVIYKSNTFAAGTEKTYDMTLLACQGLDKVSYLDSNIAFFLDVIQEKKQIPSQDFTLSIAGVRLLNKVTFTLEALDEGNTVLGTASSSMDELSPLKVFNATLSLNEAAQKCKRFNFTLKDNSGKIISKDSLSADMPPQVN